MTMEAHKIISKLHSLISKFTVSEAFCYKGAPTFVKALLYRFAFHNFSCIYVSSFLSQVLFTIVDKWFVNLLKRAPRKIGTANWVILGK